MQACHDQATFLRTDRDGQQALVVSGEIDLANATRFRDELAALVAQARSPAVVDLSAVAFIDSSGLHALLATRSAVAASDGTVVLLDPSEAARRLLEVTGTNDLFEIVYTTRAPRSPASDSRASRTSVSGAASRVAGAVEGRALSS